MENSAVGSLSLHIGSKFNETEVKGALSTQTACHYKLLCNPEKEIFRRITVTRFQGQVPMISRPYFDQGYVFDKNEGGLNEYYEYRDYLKNDVLPAGLILELCYECGCVFDEKFVLQYLAEMEL